MNDDLEKAKYLAKQITKEDQDSWDVLFDLLLEMGYERIFKNHYDHVKNEKYVCGIIATLTSSSENSWIMSNLRWWEGGIHHK